MFCVIIENEDDVGCSLDASLGFGFTKRRVNSKGKKLECQQWAEEIPDYNDYDNVVLYKR